MKQANMRIGSLCTGYGGLDMAVMEVFGGKLRWCADNDRHVSMILAVRYPGVLNLGDITTLDWPEVERVDIIAAGFPCQDISYNGRVPALRKEREVAYGRTSPRVFARYSRKSLSWRTCQRFGGAGSTRFSGTWPRTGMTRSGRAYELPTLALPTGASGSSSSASGRRPKRCSLLPTPIASDGHGGELPAKRRAGGHQVDLSDLVLVFHPPQPQATGERAGSARSRGVSTGRQSTAGRSEPDDGRRARLSGVLAGSRGSRRCSANG